MKIGIASDHRAYKKKQEIIEILTKKCYEIIDYGIDNEESVDYPTYAFKVGEDVRDHHIDCGILLCGTGIGMSIACNKVRDVRCAKVDNKEDAKYAKLHNHANVIAMGEVLDISVMEEIITTYLETKPSEEERHIRRVNMINNYRG